MHIPMLIYVLLVAHFVGDFICQSDWQAINKSKSWRALTGHVMAYTLVLELALMFEWAIDLNRPLPVLQASGLVFILVNAAAHFVQDAITSRINSKLWQANERHWFFVGIGGDQLLHYVTLFATAEWLLVGQ